MSEGRFDEATAGVLGPGTREGDDRGATTGLSASSVSASEKAADDLSAGEEARRTLARTGLE